MAEYHLVRVLERDSFVQVSDSKVWSQVKDLDSLAQVRVCNSGAQGTKICPLVEVTEDSCKWALKLKANEVHEISSGVQGESSMSGVDVQGESSMSGVEPLLKRSCTETLPLSSEKGEQSWVSGE
ncbi:unnamed protein product [Boreogadus saida]